MAGNLGAKFYDKFKDNKFNSYSFNSDTIIKRSKNIVLYRFEDNNFDTYFESLESLNYGCFDPTDTER